MDEESVEDVDIGWHGIWGLDCELRQTINQTHDDGLNINSYPVISTRITGGRG